MDWISVKDRLPDDDGITRYLCAVEFGIEIGRHTEWGWHYGTRNTQDLLQTVAYWAKLPELPK